jgi:hypothetical protein
MKRFQSPCLHHVRINGRDTSITVEPEFWEQFRLMTMERQTTIGKLLAEIDRTGRLLPHQRPGRHRVRTLSAGPVQKAVAPEIVPQVNYVRAIHTRARAFPEVG